MNKQFFSGIMLFTVFVLSAAEPVVTPGMVGNWQGSARIIVNWCQQTNLPVRLKIQRDGTVTGSIGDAVLTQGVFKQNRGSVARTLNLKTDYIIEGQLSGPIIAAEKISRTSVKMPLNFSGTNFVGGVHTSGSKFGGKRNMILSAAGLRLQRTEGR